MTESEAESSGAEALETHEDVAAADGEGGHKKHGHECCISDTTHQLEVQGLEVWYGAVRALHDVNFHIECGHCVGVLGPNGAGKSTLLKAIAGLVTPRRGTVRLHGASPVSMARDISYLPQRKAIDWAFPITVRGLVEMGRYPQVGFWRRFVTEDRAAVEAALDRLGLHDLADRQIGALSGGQQQRAFLARAWAQQAHVYLLDEPFDGLDVNAQEELSAAIRALAVSGKLVMASHHNMETVSELFDHVLLLNGGQVDFGTTEDTFTPANRLATFRDTH